MTQETKIIIHDPLVHYIPTIREVNTDEFVIETRYYH